MANILGIAKRTADRHLQRAAQKLGATNKAHAVALAIGSGVIDVLLKSIVEERADLSGDYYVVIKRHRRPPLWSWEIYRRSKPIGIRLAGGEFASAAAVKLAGEQALAELLNNIACDEIQREA